MKKAINQLLTEGFDKRQKKLTNNPFLQIKNYLIFAARKNGGYSSVG